MIIGPCENQNEIITTEKNGYYIPGHFKVFLVYQAGTGQI